MKGHGCLPFPRNLYWKFEKSYCMQVQKQDYMPQNLLQNKQAITAEATEEFIENKISEKIVKLNALLDVNSRNVKEIAIPQEKRQDIVNEQRKVL